jgi:hypothetical protein
MYISVIGSWFMYIHLSFAVSILGGGMETFPPIFPEAGGEFYIEKEGKKSTIDTAFGHGT